MSPAVTTGEGVAEWRDAQGRLHRSDGPARVFPRRIWFEDRVKVPRGARLIRVCLALAALSLLLPSAPTYDPWTWMGWGRDLASLSLDTHAGPAFKPLPVFVGAVLSPLGDAAPWVWLVIARAGALLAAVMAFRIARRLGGGSVGAAVAFAGVLLTGGWLWHGWLGNSEGLFLALALLAAERALDGRHRWALALGLAACLLRLEALPFLLAYGGWVGWRDPGARVWVAAGVAALPVAWLAPDLLAAGDAFRSSARARIPNPGAPALAERPGLESLERAIGLAPVVIWAGAVLAVVGVARRGLPRLAVLPAAAGLAWIAQVALMSELGYSGEERYAMPGIALVAISAGAGAGWAANALLQASAVNSATYGSASDGARRIGGGSAVAARLAPSLLAAVLVAIAAIEQADTLERDARSVESEARIYNAVDDAVEAAGGREAVLGCRPIHTARYSRPALAWRLRVPLRELSDAPARGGTVFRRSTSPRIERAELRRVGAAGPWTVHASCRT